jgi:uncharacterized protein YjiS (DUF1127 family)
MSTNTIRLEADLRAAAPDARGWLGWARKGFQALRRMRQRRRAIVELSRMSRWRLADLGIRQDQIAKVVDGLIEREGPGLGR